GRQRRLRPRWLVGGLLGRADGPGHGRGHDRPVRPRSRTQDLRHLRRILAARHRQSGAKSLNDATKYVASRSRPTLEWSNSVLIDGDPAEGITALKREDGPELQVHGSGDLIQTLMRHNLVDQYRLWIFPLVIGSGKRLFSDCTTPSALRLVDSKVSTTGVVMGTYEPAGEIVTGSFALN